MSSAAIFIGGTHFNIPSVSVHYPDTRNTGVPSGTSLTSSGSLTITTRGQVVANLSIASGSITVNANDVIIQNCYIAGATSTAVVYVTYGYGNCTIQNCTINGIGTTNDGSNGIQSTGSIIGCNIYNVENGINVSGADTTQLITGNYIHGLLASGSPHYDGIQMDGGCKNITISNNTIINPNPQTSCIMIDNYFGSCNNITVSNNVLSGAGYCIYSDASQANSTTYPITNITITNNHLGNGYYGDYTTNQNTPTYTGNVDDANTVLATLSL